MILADLQLAQRLEATEVAAGAEFADTYRRAYPASGAAWLAVAGGVAVFCGVGSVVNQAAGLGMSGPVGASDLDAVEGFFADRAERVAVELCPLTDHSLVLILGERGYQLEGFTNMLHQPLAEWRDQGRADVPVREIRPAEAATWARLDAIGFGDGVQQFLDIANVNTQLPSARLFIAEVDGQPAGAAMARFHGGSALFGATSVLPQFRGRGVHAAMIAARLRYAHDAGAGMALARAAPGSGSQRNLERAGFRIAYTRLRLLHPDDS